MKYSFYMNPDEYCQGYKFKMKKSKLGYFGLKGVLIFAVIAALCFLLAKEAGYAVLSFAVITVAGIISEYTKSMAVKRQFSLSPVLTGLHTLTIYDEGLEIINGYEKIFAPWKSIYAFKEQDGRLIVLPTYRKGIIVLTLNKSNSELMEFVKNLKNHLDFKEGIK